MQAADRHLERLRSLSLVSAASAPTLQPKQDSKAMAKEGSEGGVLSVQGSTGSMNSAELTMAELPQVLPGLLSAFHTLRTRL